MITYKLAKGESTIEIEIEVNKLMADGYMPTGGVSVIQSMTGTYYYYQSMIKAVF